MKTKDFPEGFFEKPRRQATEEKGFDEKTCVPVTIHYAVPVKHGKWADDAVGVLRCSECKTQAPWKYGRDFIDYRWESNYCPNCGAKMLNATALTKDARKDIDEEIERAWEYAKTD